jgi:hypothetical protein
MNGRGRSSIAAIRVFSAFTENGLTSSSCTPASRASATWFRLGAGVVKITGSERCGCRGRARSRRRNSMPLMPGPSRATSARSAGNRRSTSIAMCPSGASSTWAMPQVNSMSRRIARNWASGSTTRTLRSARLTSDMTSNPSTLDGRQHSCRKAAHPPRHP